MNAFDLRMSKSAHARPNDADLAQNKKTHAIEQLYRASGTVQLACQAMFDHGDDDCSNAANSLCFVYDAIEEAIDLMETEGTGRAPDPTESVPAGDAAVVEKEHARAAVAAQRGVIEIDPDVGDVLFKRLNSARASLGLVETTLFCYPGNAEAATQSTAVMRFIEDVLLEAANILDERGAHEPSFEAVEAARWRPQPSQRPVAKKR